MIEVRGKEIPMGGLGERAGSIDDWLVRYRDWYSTDTTQRPI